MILVRELAPKHWQIVNGNRWWTVDAARLGLPRIVNMAGKSIRPESNLGQKLLALTTPPTT
jgi:hypothetical protein